MPTIHDAGGWKITMYFFDHNPPHFHVIARGRECQVRIADLAPLAGRVPPNALNDARAWAEENRLLLMRKWRELHAE